MFWCVVEGESVGIDLLCNCDAPIDGREKVTLPVAGSKIDAVLGDSDANEDAGNNDDEDAADGDDDKERDVDDCDAAVDNRLAFAAADQAETTDDDDDDNNDDDDGIDRIDDADRDGINCDDDCETDNDDEEENDGDCNIGVPASGNGRKESCAMRYGYQTVGYAFTPSLLEFVIFPLLKNPSERSDPSK